MDAIVQVEKLSKVYQNGFQALNKVNLSIERAEILALLGPNGAGKTTLINCICGIVNLSSGTIRVADKDIVRDFRHTRRLIGLVPQELHTDAFETVSTTVNFSRGLFGLAANPAHIETVLRQLSLWDKRDTPIRALSGGMKRRVLIAKALSHEPKILFLDEPSAGVDVDLRKDMWRVVEQLRQSGVTIILTTHYIEEAEAIADRIAIINQGEIRLTEQKDRLMKTLGQKKLLLELAEPMAKLPQWLAPWQLALAKEGQQLLYYLGGEHSHSQIAALLAALESHGVAVKDLSTHQSSLEEIFVDLIKESA